MAAGFAHDSVPPCLQYYGVAFYIRYVYIRCSRTHTHTHTEPQTYPQLSAVGAAHCTASPPTLPQRAFQFPTHIIRWPHNSTLKSANVRWPVPISPLSRLHA